MGAFFLKRKHSNFGYLLNYLCLSIEKMLDPGIDEEIVFERVEVDYNQQRSGSYQDITLGTV